MTNAVIPDRVISIGPSTFDGCNNLASVFCLGDAPADDDEYLFGGNEIAIVFYLPGTTGWGETFGGRPTALWVPRISDEGLGMQAGRFGFQMDWAAGHAVVVEACSNVAAPVWLPLATNELADGTGIFADEEEANALGRFYRVVPAP